MKRMGFAVGCLLFAARVFAGGWSANDQATLAAMQNLRQIGVGFVMYSNENKGYIAKDFSQLAPFMRKPDVFLDPRLKTSPPMDDWDKLTNDQKADWVKQHCEFVMGDVGGQKFSKFQQPETTALARTRDLPGQKRMTLYADGHAEAKDPPASQPASRP